MLRKALDSPFFFPVLYLVWGIAYIALGEKLPVNDGLGWDGLRYADIMIGLDSSAAIDSYRVMRIFPSTLLHGIFSVFGVAFSPDNIVLAFGLFNLLCIVTGLFFLKKIFLHLGLSLRTQVLGFVLIIFNHAFLKFIFYYPVLTDAAAFCLGVLLLYFYLKGQELNMVLVTLIGAFTQPLLFYLGLVLLAFPSQREEVRPAGTSIQRLLSIVSVLFIGACVYYYIFSQGVVSEMENTLKLDQGLLWFSIAGIGILYWFLPALLNNAELFRASYWLRKLSINRILLCFFLLLCVLLVSHKINYRNVQGDGFGTADILRSTTLQGLTEPLIAPSAHAFFFGLVIVLMIVFWRSFCREAFAFGPGLMLSVLLAFYLFGNINESRRLICLFPWLAVLVLRVLDKQTLPSWFTGIVAVLSLVLSRAWLRIGYDINGGLDAAGTMDFPNQKFFMNLGPWMSKEMWQLQFIVLLGCILLAVLYFYKFDLKRLKFSRRNS